MVHVFSYPYKNKDRYFIYDVESGSLLNVELPVFLIAKKRYSLLTNQESLEYKKISQVDIDEINLELEELEKENILDSKILTEAKEKRYGTLKAMCLLICQDCNMRCKYCFADDGTYSQQASSMNIETAKASVDYLISKSGKRKILEIDFFGGEPLLNFKVVQDCVDYANSQAKKYNKEFHFTMTTNCLALSPKKADYLNKTMHNVVLSIDGRDWVHNYLRKAVNGRNTHDIILKNAQYFAKIREDKSYYVRGTFTAKNLDFSKDILYLAENGFSQISLEPVLTTVEDIEILHSHLEDIKNEYENFAIEYIQRRKNKKQWFNFFHFYLDLKNGPCLTKRLTGCGAGCEYISVATNGDIYPCHQYTQYSDKKIGNVFDKSFDLNLSKYFASNVVNNKPKCIDCFAKYYCSGGCAANNFSYNGDMNIPYEITCELIKKRFELSLFIYAIENTLS